MTSVFAQASNAGTDWTTVAATIAAAISAVAAAVSAWFSRRALERAARPYVWPDHGLRPADEDAYADATAAHEEEDDDRLKQLKYVVCVRLHNDGPGLALDVQWSVEHRPYRPKRLGVRGLLKMRSLQPLKRRRQLRAMSTSMVAMLRDAGARALPSGEVAPGQGHEPQQSYPAKYMEDKDWTIVVRYSDVAGRRWEYRERAFSRRDLAPPPKLVRRRLRREKLDDGSHRWHYGWEW